LRVAVSIRIAQEIDEFRAASSFRGQFAQGLDGRNEARASIDPVICKLSKGHAFNFVRPAAWLTFTVHSI